MVRHVGDPVALVVAGAAAAARDGAEAVDVEYDEREPMRRPRPRRRSRGAADLARGVRQYRGRLARVRRSGCRGSCPARRDFCEGGACRAGAAHQQRIVMAPMEPRGALAGCDAGTGAPRSAARRKARSCCAITSPEGLGVAPDRVRVVTGDVGGAFGMRTTSYPNTGAAGRRKKQPAAPCIGSGPGPRVPHRQPGARRSSRRGSRSTVTASSSRSTSTSSPR